MSVTTFPVRMSLFCVINGACEKEKLWKGIWRSQASGFQIGWKRRERERESETNKDKGEEESLKEKIRP